MRIQHTLFNYSGLTCNIVVTDNKSSSYPNFIFNNKYSKIPTLNLEYSVYLTFNLVITIINDKGEEEKISEYFSISFFDMHNFNSTLSELQTVLTSEFYEEIEKVDLGIIKRIKPEYKKPFVITTTTKKWQLAFIPIITYNRKDDIYTPKVKVIINRDDVGVNLPIDIIQAIIYNLLNIDLHQHAMNLVTLSYSNKLYSKKLINESQSKIQVT